MRPCTDQEWAFIQQRDRNGRFIIAVLTTGIFCRTGCPARTPKRDNIVIFKAAEDAASQGFRPCLRCSPLGVDPVLESVVAVARAIESAPDEAWDQTRLAEVSGVGARVLRTRFQDVLGLSPTAFRDAVRLRCFKTSLREGSTVTNATYEAGFSGPARRHEAAKKLGMTPSAYAKGGAGETIEYVVVPTTLGTMLLAATERGICRLHFLDGPSGREVLEAEYPKAELIEASPDTTVSEWAEDVAQFLRAERPRPDLPVDLRGTAFQMKVWAALQDIPAGQTMTYGELAEQIGHDGAYRAVGNANGKNPVAVIVPCHLVLASGGKLGGYAGGLDRKRALLELEDACPDDNRLL